MEKKVTLGGINLEREKSGILICFGSYLNKKKLKKGPDVCILYSLVIPPKKITNAISE